MVSRIYPLSHDERSMMPTDEFLVFSIQGWQCALPLGSVHRIVRAAAVTPLPNAPAVVLGVVDLEGTVIPVFNLRRRFNLPDRALGVSDQFLIAHTREQQVILVIDHAQGVRKIEPGRITQARAVVPGLQENTRGVAALAEGLILIQDLDAFLSLDEAAALQTALLEREAGLAQ